MAESITIARPYSRAAFEVARQDGSIQQWSEALSLLARLISDDQVHALLLHPGLTADKKADLLIEIMGSDAPQPVTNFIRILAQNARLPLLADIQKLFEFYRSQLDSSVDVLMETAFEIDSEMQAKLGQVLEKKLERKVSLETKLNKDLIGGVLVRAGDLVIDASVRGKLAKLAAAVNA